MWRVYLVGLLLQVENSGTIHCSTGFAYSCTSLIDSFRSDICNAPAFKRSTSRTNELRVDEVIRNAAENLTLLWKQVTMRI